MQLRKKLVKVYFRLTNIGIVIPSEHVVMGDYTGNVNLKLIKVIIFFNPIINYIDIGSLTTLIQFGRILSPISNLEALTYWTC